MRRAILFSKPSSFSLEKGRLLGSERTTSVPGRVVCADAEGARVTNAKKHATRSAISAGTDRRFRVRLLRKRKVAHCALSEPEGLRDREDIQRPSLGGVLREVFHRVDETERRGSVSRV